MNAFPSLNSEEAKSTTWLHPVSGEAVITGHRKTPGKDVTEQLSSFSVVFQNVCRVRRHVSVFPVSENGHFPHRGREGETLSHPCRVS